MAEVFGFGFMAGLALAIPLGPMAILLISTTLSRGWRYGVAGGLAMATVDFFYSITVFLLGGAILTFLGDWKSPLAIAGAAILVLLGVLTLLRNLNLLRQKQGEPVVRVGSKGVFATGVTFAVGTVINPPTALYFLAITPAVATLADSGLEVGFIFSLGVFIGSGIWQQALAIGGHGLRRLLNPRVRAAIGVVGGVLIIALAITLMARGIQ